MKSRMPTFGPRQLSGAWYELHAGRKREAWTPVDATPTVRPKACRQRPQARETDQAQRSQSTLRKVGRSPCPLSAQINKRFEQSRLAALVHGQLSPIELWMEAKGLKVEKRGKIAAYLKKAEMAFRYWNWRIVHQFRLLAANASRNSIKLAASAASAVGSGPRNASEPHELPAQALFLKRAASSDPRVASPAL